MTVPQFEEMKMPILKRLGELATGASASADEMRAFVIKHFDLSGEDVSKMWKRVPEYSGQMQWALTDMAHAGIIERPARGRYAIADEGRRILESGETDLSRSHLKEAYPSFAAFVSGENNGADEEVQEGSDEEPPVNLGKLNGLIVGYRKALAENWSGESYKWKAVKRFQDEWDIDAADFASMLDRALDGTHNLLTSGNYYARNMVSGFAHANPEKTRAMFRALYDEDEELGARMEAFAAEAETFRDEPTYDGWKSTYQDARAISAYLWLRYPDKYYLYKYTVFRDVAKAIDSGFVPKKGGISKNVLGGYKMYDYVRNVLAADSDVIATVTSLIDENCYPDPEHVTLTADFGFYASICLPDELEEDTPPQQVDSAESAKDDDSSGYAWFLGAAYGQGSIDQTPRFLEDGIWENGYDDKYLEQVKSIKPGDRVAIKAAYTRSKDLPFENNGNTASVMMIKARGRVVSNEGDGRTIYVDWDAGFEPKEWFFYTYRGTVWRVTTDSPSGSRLIDFTFSDLAQDYNWFTSDPYWSDRFGAPANADTVDEVPEPYGKDRFLEEVFMDESAYNKLVALLKRKRNVILQGAPGTGKTFAAERLAWSLMGEKDGGRVQMVQFHQSTSYDEFICGYRPDQEGNFAPKTGMFVDFCDRAASDPDRQYFFIIDEINRANISKVFGELLMLIEADKRGKSVTLPVVNRTFSVPENVYLLGMMNTADRGLALIDYALRRRFAFFEMDPAVGTQRFGNYIEALDNEELSRFVDAVAKLNSAIAEDDALGRGFRIGHSYFCLQKGATDEDVESIVEYEIAPLLEEYWFDNPKRAEDEITKLKAAIA
ncbi:restriction endonuclease [Paraeggerthella hongkongensis]|uniref:AAA family ATPase n=1 Tax=Paraeggerthella sp. TaxID=2897350 RepID=UPI000DF7810C|nr:restriction endonuclease [Paraeggerthella hongkongensis]